MINRIILIGRLTKKPELKETKNLKKVSIFTLAVSRDYKNSAGIYETDFINCKSFFNAENIEKYCDKGDLISVAGRLQTGSYEKNGQKYYTSEVICDKVVFLQTKKKENTTETEEEKGLYDDTDIYKEFGDSVEITDDDIAF